MKRLDELDEVPWSTLEHAYGSAADVPGLIRDLISADKSVRENAVYELHGNIWHQGTTYEATASAVPYLAGLVANGPREMRVEILALLTEIADGNSYLLVHPTKKGNGSEAKLKQELGWVRDARSAVAAELELFERLLADEDNEVKLLAAFLLGVLKRDIEWDSAEFLQRVSSRK